MTNFFNKNTFLVVVIISIVVSAFVGGIFGYYGANFFNHGSSILQQIVRPAQISTDEEQKVETLVRRTTPAVVSIVASKDLTVVEQQGIYNPFQDFCQDPFFRQMLGDQCNVQSQPPQTKTETQQVAAGSGFIISSDGLILTNKHVINVPGAAFTVITNDGKKYPAKILAQDPVQDLAMVKIDATGLPFLTLANSNSIQIGQTVIAIGNALGQFSNTVSKGVVSGLSRSITASENGGQSEQLSQLIQTDAAINPGNSGGPLLNLSGQVIGIDVAIAEGAQNIGFAIPINQAKKDITQVKTSGKISYPFLGIRYVLIDDTVKKANNLSVSYGALIIKGQNASDAAVTPGSPAEKAGIREGDIILEINGQQINVNNDLTQLLQKFNVGDTITLKVLSQGKEKTLQITLGERK